MNIMDIVKHMTTKHNAPKDISMSYRDFGDAKLCGKGKKAAKTLGSRQDRRAVKDYIRRASDGDDEDYDY